MANKKTNPSLAIIILANCSGKIIKDALISSQFAPEILVIDTNKLGSNDGTLEITKKYKAKYFNLKTGGLSDWRNAAIQKTNANWLFYLDADERITPQLADELLLISQNTPKKEEIGVFDVPRNNYYLGRKWHKGDWITRFFHRDRLIRWQGDLHETPIITGALGKLSNSIDHLTHTDIESMTLKTLKWSKIEGYLLYEKGHPPMYWWRFPRVMFRELYKRLIREQYWRNGIEGWIEAIFQMFSVFFTYVRLWEFQNGKLRKESTTL